MESPQSVVSPFMASEKQNPDIFTKNLGFISTEPEPEPQLEPGSGLVLGVLDVFIHQARDIHNICIYHKQDVYAKICLTSDPEKAVTTNTINGGGQNPVFNENLRINVLKLDSSLKCEIYMLSRVRNYLEDQLLGVALIPLSEVLVENGRLEKEFTLSSTDLFHSPAGFIRLSLSYDGATPDVIEVPPRPAATAADEGMCELNKIEFPDPKIAKEDHMMVSEYIGLCSENLVSSDTDDLVSLETVETLKPDSPLNSVSSNGSQCASVTSNTTTEESDNPSDGFKSSNQEQDSGKPAEGGNIESGSTNKSVVSVNLELEKAVQQDFVDLYMKSMQQFTESLAKMKLPLDAEREPTSSDNSIPTPNSTRGTRVFYGSRAFF